LVDFPWSWRERLVEELTFGAAGHVRVESAFQVNFPPELVERYVNPRKVRFANVLLPITSRLNEPLLSLDITGPAGRPAQLVGRASIASLEAEYLGRVASTSGAGPTVRAGVPDHLLEAICIFTPDIFDHLARPDASHQDNLLRYLQSGFGKRLQVSSDDIARWAEASAAAGAVLCNRLGLAPNLKSSSEEVLLALPRLDPLPGTIEDVNELVNRYADAVHAADVASDDEFLVLLGQYGRGFELVVEVEVPILEPFTIKVADDRPLRLPDEKWYQPWRWSRSRNRSYQSLRLRDARSVHIEARVSDPSVKIGSFDLRDQKGQEIGIGPLESARLTDEKVSLYAFAEERPEHAELEIELASVPYVRVPAIVLAPLLIVAAVLAACAPPDDVLVERLALLVVPTTLAATFMLVREQSALAARLQDHLRLALGFLTLLLWVVALFRLATFDAVSPVPERATPDGRHEFVRPAVHDGSAPYNLEG
jgi:hypothetical protein